jgi:hypothetical protein
VTVTALPRTPASVPAPGLAALIEEARKRARRRRAIHGTLALAALPLGAVAFFVITHGDGGVFGGQKRSASVPGVAVPPGTALNIVAVNPNVGRALFHLRCAPARGDLPDNATACAALASMPTLVRSPKPFVCWGGTTSWWDIMISGRLDGQRIRRTVSTCWTPQMATIDRLGLGRDSVLQSHLVPRRQENVIPGVRRTFLPGVLRAGDLLTCDILGHHLEAGVPSRSGEPSSVGISGNHIDIAILQVSRDRGGTVSASCHAGDS